jgi:hypothetical protein
MAQDHEIARHLIGIIDRYNLWEALQTHTGLDRGYLEAHVADESPVYETREELGKDGKVMFTHQVKLRETLESAGALRKICDALGLPYYDVYHLREVVPEDMEWCRELDRLGIQYHRTNDDVKKVPTDRSWIDKVKLDLTPNQWCNLCMRDGNQYVGGCCGTSSAMQDIVNGAFRDDGWLEAHDLRRLADLGISHDGKASPYTDTALLKRWGKPLGPWTKLGCLWQFCEPNLRVGWVEDLPTHKTDPVRLAQASLFSLSYHDHFSIFLPDPKDGDEAAQAQHQAIQILNEAKYLAALKTLRNHFTALSREPFDGFAIRCKATGELAVNGYGACVYATEAQAQEMIDCWARDTERYKVGTHEVVTCRVTLEDGCVWADKDAP